MIHFSITPFKEGKMRRFITAFIAAIFVAISFIFAFAENANAKTAFIAYGSKSLAPNGAFSDWDFSGDPAFGGGIRFGMDGRFSFGLDYMGQKMNGETSRIFGMSGQNFISDANYFGVDISKYNITPEELFAYADIGESGLLSVATGTFYISLMPENGSRLIVEPVIGFVGGISIVQHRTDSNAFYHQDLYDIESLFGEEHFRFASWFDDGSGHARETKSSYKPLVGLSFGLNFFPVENIIVAPEIRYLYNFGFNVRTGIGVAF